MVNLKKTYLILIMIVFSAIFLSGCSDTSYEHMIKIVENSIDGAEEATSNIKNMTIYYAYKIYLTIKPILKIVGIGSILIGIIIYKTAEKSQSVKKIALFLGIIIIPLIMFLTYYIYPLILTDVAPLD